MKNRILKAISVLLCFSLFFSFTFATPASAFDAAEKTAEISADSIKETAIDSALMVVSNLLDKIATVLIKVISVFLPQAGKYTKLKDYVSEHFYKGTEKFIKEPKENATWSLGYAQRIITPDDLKDGKYYMGGFAVANIIVDKFDDLKVRTVCIDDGSGRGKTIFAVIDAIGISNKDVRLIREAFEKKAAGIKDVVAINVSVTHVHSAIDTQGIWAVFGVYKNDPINILKTLFPIVNKGEPVSGVDKTYMQRIYDLTSDAMLEAYNNMTEGDLYYAEIDGGDYFRYRKDPVNWMRNMSRLRFDPFVNQDDDTSNDVTPTMIANFGCHPELVGYKTDDNPGNIASADFIPYMEKVINNGGYNFLFIQGAIGEMITANNGKSSDGLDLVRYQGAVRQGEEYGFIYLGMTLTEEECIRTVVDHEREEADLKALGENKDSYTPWYKDWVPAKEEKLDPILNIALEEVVVKCDNPVVEVIGKLGITSNDLLKDKAGKFYTVTEIGYIEIGKTIKVLVSPGETNPEFILGGRTMEKATSIKRKDFQYKPLKEYFDKTDHILVFDVMNDAAGYINPDNDYSLVVLRYHDGEIASNFNAFLFSLSSDMGSILIGTFLEIVSSNF
ncbi:MAG: hypothetical protein K6F09_07515 [Clostridiales bacterium]|nr:hypothetical protein [Clostridiales bacterium]